MAANFVCACCCGRGGVFSNLPPALRSRLAGVVSPHAYRRGQTIFHEGTPALAVHCIRSGTVKVSRLTGDGHEVLVGVRRPGELIGFRAVLAELPCSITAETLEPAVVCTIPREIFMDLVRESTDLSIRLLKQLAREVHFAEEQLVERTRQRVSKRTARLLARLEQGGAPGSRARPWLGITMSREEMALLIGTTPETLSRTLHSLAEQGILELGRRVIRVRDVARLLNLAK
jgi:CRP-like cAMP-binding protein